MDEKIKNSELTQFAKDLVVAHNSAIKYIVKSEDIEASKIRKEIITYDNQELLLEISKRFAKYARAEMSIDLECSSTQDTQDMLNKVIRCCDENDWFM